MDEFSLIHSYFQSIPCHRNDVVFGIGDDAACLQVPHGMQLLVSTDTLLADVHFLSAWDAYDIAYKAVMVNVSDIAAMGGSPAWVTLALSLPEVNHPWLKRFSKGLQEALARYDVALVGGDTTRGPLALSLTIHGFISNGCAVRRCSAQVGDKIYVSGFLGAAALAVACEGPIKPEIAINDYKQLMHLLKRPVPRVDLAPYLQQYATAAIDISDGLSVDLGHICTASSVGARLMLNQIPIHPLVKKYQNDTSALDFALSGGDDYELCFTVSLANEGPLLQALAKAGLKCYCIGDIEAEPGMRGVTDLGASSVVRPRGYNHFV